MSRDLEGEFHLIVEGLKLYHDCFWTHFRMLVGEIEAFLQMSVRNLHLVCQTMVGPEGQIMSLSAIVVVLLWEKYVTSVSHNHCIMHLFIVRKLRKIDIDLKK